MQLGRASITQKSHQKEGGPSFSSLKMESLTVSNAEELSFSVTESQAIWAEAKDSKTITCKRFFECDASKCSEDEWR